MKKTFKSLLSFLFVMIFVFQFTGVMASAAAPDTGMTPAGTDVLGYQLSVRKVNADSTTSDTVLAAENETTEFGEGKTCSVKLGDTALNRTAAASLSELLSKDISIDVPAGYYVAALYLRSENYTAADAIVSLLPSATARTDSASLTLTSRALTLADTDKAVDTRYLNKELVTGAAGGTYTLEIVLQKIDPKAAIAVTDAGGNAIALADGKFTAPAAPAAGAYKQFDGWKLSYANGSSVLVAAGTEVTPYASCALAPVFSNIVYTATVTAENKSMTVGEALPAYTAAVSGQTLDTMAIAGFSFKLMKDGAEVTDTSALAAGEYDIAVSGGTVTDTARENAAIPAENYSLSYVYGKLTVTAPAAVEPEKTALTITANSPVYDAATKAFKANGYTAATLKEGDAIAAADITLTVTKTDAGYISTPSAATIKNAAGNDVSASYTITYTPSAAVPAPVDVTITANKPVPDGTAYKADGYTYDNTKLTGGDKIDSVTFDVAKNNDGKWVSTPTAATIVDKDNKAVAAGKYNIILVASAAVDPTVTTRGEITVTAKDRTETYNGTLITANDYTLTGTLATGDTITVTYGGGTTNVAANVDSNPIVVIKDSAGTDVTSKYTVKPVSGKVTVNKFAMTVTAASATKDYDGKTFADSDIKKATLSGSANGSHKVHVTLQVQKNGSKVSSPTEVGTYDNVITNVSVKDSSQSDADVTANYDITVKNGTLTIKTASTGIALTVTAKSGTWTYDGTAHTLNGNDAYTVSGLVNGDKITKVTFDSASTITNAGTQANKITGVVVSTESGAAVDSGKYKITYVAGTLTVNKFDLTITAESASKSYDGKALENKNVSSTKLANSGHKLSAEYSIYDSKNNKITSPIEVGTYTKKITSYTVKDGNTDVTANYNVKTVDGTLTIKSSDKNNSTAVKTGDESNATLWIVLLAASALLVVAVVVYILVRNKKKNAADETVNPDFDDTGDNDDDPNDPNV